MKAGGNAMNQKSTCLSAGMLLSALICPAGEASVPEKIGFTITIHVYNYAAVSEKTLARAKEETGRIFGCAGLTALWLDQPVEDGDLGRPGGPTASWDGTHFVLRLLTQSREGLAKYAVGEALSFRIANIFMNRVTEHLRIGALSAGPVLGHAIAHEIGHHLLGDNSHGLRGIMVGNWSKQHLRHMSKGDLLFTHEEAARMQAEVKHRNRPDINTQASMP
jgi:hypothetical protein